ncbi:sugar transferase [uncultured Bifidobacterium sp.]|uniref:sugar transferase n=1 Tax=uncultured Bifidobacterium sp. TaxID=165187 RepID=UPI002621DACD|nr:sugar transferase [uncultured Bifidobacterium sp.]
MSSQKRPSSRDRSTSFFDGTYFPTNSLPRRNGVFAYSAPHWSYLYNATLILLDAIMSLLSTTIVVLVHSETKEYISRNQLSGDDVLAMAALVTGVWILCLAGARIYTRHMMGQGYEVYSRVIAAGFYTIIALCTIIYLFKLFVPRQIVLAVPLLSVLFTLIERWFMRRSLQRNRARGGYNYATVIVGSPEGIHQAVEQLDGNTALGYAPFAVCAVANGNSTSDRPNPQHLVHVPFTPTNDRERTLRVLPLDSHLPQTAKDLGARTMVITDVMSRHSETMRTLSLAMESMGIELAFSAGVADIDGATLHLRDNASMPVFTATLPQYSTRTRIIKRVMDIIGSLLALIISSPVMAVVALLVRAEDGGPAIYKQQRIGLYGKTFTLYKFRSMHVNADKIDAQLAKEMGENHGILFKPKDDPRITRIGRFIRKTSLDEFPQFLNVLIGNMSLVGPRPQQQYEVNEYASLYSTRLLVKPGITGLWQVSGRSDLSQEESERLDVSYVERWSINGDIAILLKTITAVIRGTGSY